MANTRVKKDTEVVVITGASRGRRGRVLSVDREKGLVLVEGCNTRKKAVRRSQEHPQGGIIEVDCPIHISNVMLQEIYDARHSGAGPAPAPEEPSEGESE